MTKGFLDYIFAAYIVNKDIIFIKDKMVYINILTDFGFKRIFGSEENKDILISFLNACLSGLSEPITELEFLPTEQLGMRPSEKRVVFDLYCKSQCGEHFIIELQRSPQHFYADRSISYVSRIISRELRRGDKRYRIPKVYSINILDFDADEFKSRAGYFWPVRLKDADNEIFSEKFTLIFIELNKFAARNKSQELSDELQQWLYLLKNISKMEAPDQRLQQDVFRRVFENCEYSKLDVMEKENYQKSVLEYEDVQDAMRYAQERGEEEGFEKGKMEGKMEIARTMLDNKVAVQTIAKYTGLTEEEILSL